jgi:hypothetical protein
VLTFHAKAVQTPLTVGGEVGADRRTGAYLDADFLLRLEHLHLLGLHRHLLRAVEDISRGRTHLCVDELHYTTAQCMDTYSSD